MANIPNIPFSQVVKNPAIWGYFMIVTLLVSLVWFFVTSNKENDTNCIQEKAELRIELKDERKKNDNLINSILIKQGVIEKLTVITDSLNKKENDTIK